MTRGGVAALRAERDALQWWAEPLYGADEFWARPSGCPGWSRLDVVAHLADLFRQVVDRTHAPDPADDARRADRAVDAARGRRPLSVLGEYLSVAAPAIEVLAEWQVPVAGDRLVHFGWLGQYPAHLWADRLVAEHLVHRCVDLHGGAVLYDSLGPAVEAGLAALPQTVLTPTDLAHGPVTVRVGVPAMVEVGATVVGDVVAIHSTPSPAPAAVVDVTPEAFVRWIHGRPTAAREWTVSGDPSAVASWGLPGS